MNLHQSIYIIFVTANKAQARPGHYSFTALFLILCNSHYVNYRYKINNKGTKCNLSGYDNQTNNM